MFKRIFFAIIFSFLVFQLFVSKFEMSGRSAVNKDVLDKNGEKPIDQSQIGFFYELVYNYTFLRVCFDSARYGTSIEHG